MKRVTLSRKLLRGAVLLSKFMGSSVARMVLMSIHMDFDYLDVLTGEGYTSQSLLPRAHA